MFLASQTEPTATLRFSPSLFPSNSTLASSPSFFRSELSSVVLLSSLFFFVRRPFHFVFLDFCGFVSASGPRVDPDAEVVLDPLSGSFSGLVGSFSRFLNKRAERPEGQQRGISGFSNGRSRPIEDNTRRFRREKNKDCYLSATQFDGTRQLSKDEILDVDGRLLPRELM